MITLENNPQTTVIAGENGWPRQGAWTYADYLRLPDDGNRYEIIQGVLHVANAPTPEHQYTVTELIFYLRQYVAAHPLGIVLTAPIEVHLSETTRPVQPDLIFVANDRQPPPGQGFIDGAPALIVEVVSPTSIRRDRKIKFDLYEEAGVAEYWIVDPRTRSVEVYTWSNGEYALFGQFIADELTQSKRLPGLSIPTNRLFYPQST
ncbi:MAG: Uma2 family endonuclease [Caldilineaceae bacterium]